MSKGHDLIQHFPVLGRHSNNRFDSVRIFPHFENKRTHLDGLRPRSKDCHDFKFFHNYAPILAILQDADFLGTNEDDGNEYAQKDKGINPVHFCKQYGARQSPALMRYMKITA